MKVGCDAVYSDYKLWCEDQKIKPESKESLGKILNKLIPYINRIRMTFENVRPWFYELPKLEQAREGFQKAYKTGLEIWD